MVTQAGRVVSGRDILYVNQKPPLPQTCHMTISFPHDGNLQLVDTSWLL